MRQRLRRACASLHSQFSIDGSGMSSITTFMLNGLILCHTTQTTTWKKALLYISLYKQTNLANLLSCLTLWFACFFKVNIVTSTVTCKINVQFRRPGPKSFMVSISLHGRFLAVNVTPNPCPRRVCLMSVTMLKLMTIAEEFRWIEGFL